jgi:hypothetical protein
VSSSRAPHEYGRLPVRSRPDTTTRARGAGTASIARVGRRRRGATGERGGDQAGQKEPRGDGRLISRHQLIRRSFVTFHRSIGWSSKVSPSRYSR